METVRPVLSGGDDRTMIDLSLTVIETDATGLLPHVINQGRGLCLENLLYHLLHVGGVLEALQMDHLAARLQTLVTILAW